MPASPDEFRGALRRFASGVTVVTARGPDGDHGMTASAFCSVSLNPPRILVCVGKTSAFHAILDEAGACGITILGDEQRALSDRFARRRAPGEDRFADLSVQRAPASGAAWLAGGLAWLDCRVVGRFDGGDHTIFLGEVEHARVRQDIEPDRALLYAAGRYHVLGGAM